MRTLVDLAHDEDDDDVEKTSVGLSREEVLALMREADEREAPASCESGIRLTEEQQKMLAIATPLVVVPRAPFLPAIEDELDDREDTVIASVLPPAPAGDSADDELARVLDFDWERASRTNEAAPAEEHEPSTPPLELVRREPAARITPLPREPIPWPVTPALDPPRGLRGIAIAVSLSVAAAALFVFLAWLIADR